MEFEIEKYPNKEKCRLVSVDSSFVVNVADLERITEICNQPPVHKSLEAIVGNNPYTVGDARGFIEWAKDGWLSEKWYVFLVRDSNNKILACVDIKVVKDSDTGGREIGFWADSENPGVVTNSAFKLIEFAKTKGINKLYGLTDKSNTRSSNVLLRTGFEQVTDQKLNEIIYNRFEKYL